MLFPSLQHHLPIPPPGPQSVPNTHKGAQELNLESNVSGALQVCGIDREGMYMFPVIRYCPYLKSEINLSLSRCLRKESVLSSDLGRV